MRTLNWLCFVCLVPFIAFGIALYCFFISIKQGIECAAEMLDE